MNNKEIFEKIKKLTLNKSNEKLNELFSYVDCENHNILFDKLENILYYLEPYSKEKNDNFIKDFDLEKAINLCIDSLIELYYFNLKIEKKDGYNYMQIRNEYNNIKKYIINEKDVILKIPIHPNINYRDTYNKLQGIYKIKKEDTLALLNLLFNVSKKMKANKQYLKEIQSVSKEFEEIKNTLINYPNLNESFNNLSKKEKEKEIKKLDEIINDWKNKIKNH